MKRRAFLQHSGGALALAGLVRHQQVLAAPTLRKLALLVGINQYDSPLHGCVTDVQLQRELLIHRFGFLPGDILTLTDQQATHSAIVQAFLSHLTQQAKPGDVVVVHFSGYGSRVLLPTSRTTRASLVTADVPIVRGESLVEDLLIDTLLLLLRSLPTDNLTTVLDTSHAASPDGRAGDLQTRTRPGAAIGQPSEAVLALRAELLRQTGMAISQLGVQERSGQFPGVMLRAARLDQTAVEFRTQHFSAGLFTHALTQQLWQATPARSLRLVLRRTQEQIEPFVHQNQQLQLQGQKGQTSPLPPYFVAPTWGSDSVVTAVDGAIVGLWLGGLPVALVESYGVGSQMTIVAPDAPLLQLVSCDGLHARAKAIGSSGEIRVGQLVREQVRVLPRNPSLRVALDSSLERIERVDAISALSTVARIATAIAPAAADCLFSKVSFSQVPSPLRATSTVAGRSPLSARSNYGLFSLAGEALPGTIGQPGEAVKTAVRRLLPTLQKLLALKLLNWVVNENASQVAVRAALELPDAAVPILVDRQTLGLVQTQRDSIVLATTPVPELAKLALGSRLQFRLENHSPDPLYVLLLSWDGGDFVALHPALRDTTSEPINPGESLTLPQVSSSFRWVVSGRGGVTETHLLCSRAPFHQAEAVLNNARSAEAAGLLPIAASLDLAQAVLHDLQQASVQLNPDKQERSGAIALHLNAWASFRFVYQITA